MTSETSGSFDDPPAALSIDRLRALHRSAHEEGAGRIAAGSNPIATARAVELSAKLTPAWTEPHVAILDRLIEQAGSGPNATVVTADEDVVSALKSIRAGIDGGDGADPTQRCPQVVGLDIAEMACTRAEWIDGNLHLHLVPAGGDADGFTYFRVIGAEPRMWEVHGVPNARIESTLSGLNVRVPMRRSAMELIRSSY